MAVPTVRRLVVGDEAVIALLAEREPQTALLADERTLFVVAFDEETPVGFAFGYVLPRRHGDAEMLFVYEVDVDEGYRRQGTATRLLRELERLARERGVREAFVLADADNDPAAGLYASVGGEPLDVVQWELRYPAA
jgi:ribosomal protein S18 acetylase RimI-like enzyme